MKKYIIKNKANGSVIGTFDSKEELFKCIMEAAGEGISELILDVKEIEDYPLTFEDACKFLGIPEDAIVLTGGNEIGKSAVAFYKLAIIAKAWNKIDGFVPDFSNIDQSKHFPWFLYRTEHAGFVCTGTSTSASSASSAIGSRLCFASSATAQKFGETFTALYNEMFL